MGTETAVSAEIAGRSKQSRKQRPTNPLQAGVQTFLDTRPHIRRPNAWSKRYTLYAPLLLLPVNFTTHSVEWGQVYSSLTSDERRQLFQCIVTAFADAGQQITHVAINAPIALKGSSVSGGENVVRSPSGLLPVWGDFGPERLLECNKGIPSQEDFDAAFWISTTQDHGVHQLWAPRWTMFSHGNLSEKRRILDARAAGAQSFFPGQDAAEIKKMQVLDLYVGIGYFALCYLARGVDRVWGWDLNAWSVEGLRRGCEANGWRCMVLHVDANGECDIAEMDELTTQLVAERSASSETRIRCVAFVGDNKWASKVLRCLERLCMDRAPGSPSFVAKFDHVNLGLLPSSAASWPNAIALVAAGGILHIHENVQYSEIEMRSLGIEHSIWEMLREQHGGGQARLRHVEQVKTYAPGIVHCVLDIDVDVASS